jgi:hypothetical protein
LELFPDELQLKITVRTELKGEQMSNLSWLIFAAVDSLVKEWYNLNVRLPSSSTSTPPLYIAEIPTLNNRQRCLCPARTAWS